MTGIMRMVAFAAAMSMSAAVVPATMDSPVRSPSTSAPPPATGATEVTPADPPARPNMVPGGAGALVLPGAILIGVAAAVASGGGDDPAPFPATGTTGTR